MFRLEPPLPATAYQTYQIMAPVETHWREATCAEVACPNLEHGWVTRVREETDAEVAQGYTLGRRQAHYIRTTSGRRYVEHRTPDGITEFVFEPGQTCFGQHRVKTGRPEYFLRRGGDWRGDPTGARPFLHQRAQDWVEDFALHQQQLVDLIEKG